MSRILRHISAKDLKRTHQKKLSEKKKLAAQKLKEQQKEELERNEIEEAARPYKSDWRKETNLQESDWTPAAGSISNSSAQTFHYATPNFETGEPIAVTVSGLGGVESVPSTTTIDSGFGDISSVDAPNYSQLGLQGYAPPLGGVQRQTQQSENERIDAEIRKLEEQIKESKAKETAAIDAWNAELRATMDRHGREWEAVLKKDGVYNPEKHKGLQARHDAEIEAIWSKEPKTEPYETERQNLRAKIAELEKQRPINQQLDASQQAYPNLPMMNARVQPAVGTSPNELVPTPDDDVLDQVASLPGLASAKNFVDHYIDNFVQGDGKQNQNLTNLLSRSDQNWLKNALSKEPAFTNPRPFDNPQKVFDNLMQLAPRGIRNSIGNGAKLDMDYYKKTGDFKISKDYVFTQEKDLEYRGIDDIRTFWGYGPSITKPIIDAPKNYAKLKMGGDISPLIQNPMRFHVIIPGPRRKKKKEEELGESTWSKLKKYR